MIKESALVYRLSADNSRLARDLAKAKGQLSRFKGQSSRISSEISSHFTRMFGATAIIYGIGRLSTNTIDLIKRTDSLNKALTAVTETSEGYAHAQEFLRKTARDYGVEIEGLTRSYNKFIASSKGTTLEGQQTEDIFKKVTKASSVMALSADETEGVLRALGQIMSKGKVQAEELRGQLGDRLPGAFNIMADAMGVTTAQLDKMLKDGKVMADEVLPAFADQLLKAYGADKVTEINTIVAAQNRLSNAWKEFVSSVDSGSGIISQALKGIFNTLTNVLTADETGIEIGAKYAEGLGISNDKLQDEIKRYERLSNLIRKEIIKLEKETKTEDSRFFGLVKVSKEDSKVLEQIKTLQNEYAKTTGILSALYKQELKHNKELEESAKKTNNLAKEIEEAEKKYKSLLDLFNVTLSDDFQNFDYSELQNALRNAVPRENMFDGEISDMIGLDPEEAREYWEEINGIFSQGFFSLQEIINSEGGKVYQGLFDTGMFIQEALVGISDAIAGAASFGDVFRTLFTMLAENMQRFGAALIAWGTGLQALKKSFSNPGAAIAAGFGLLAAGTLIKSALSNAQRDFSAVGSGGGGGSFQNNVKGQTIQLNGEFRISGRDLVTTINNQNKLNNKVKIS